MARVPYTRDDRGSAAKRPRGGFTKFVDMAMTDEDKIDALKPMPVSDIPDYPWGLRICLCDRELDKLDIGTEFELGDTIDLRALAKVTSVSSNSGPDGQHRRVELQIEQLAVEVEDDE